MRDFMRFIVLVFFMSCSYNKDKNIDYRIDNQVFNNLLITVIDSTIVDDRNENIIYLRNYKEDKMKEYTVEYYLKKATQIENKKLAKKILNSNYKDILNPKLIEVENLIIVFDSDYINRLLDENPEIALGYFSISEIVINENSDHGCFYYSIQMGEYGGGTYLIFLSRDKSGWKVKDIVKLFEGAIE